MNVKRVCICQHLMKLSHPSKDILHMIPRQVRCFAKPCSQSQPPPGVALSAKDVIF